MCTQASTVGNAKKTVPATPRSSTSFEKDESESTAFTPLARESSTYVCFLIGYMGCPYCSDYYISIYL